MFIRNLKVFLCHANEDKSSVIHIYERLLKDGIEPWLDTKKLLPGQDFRLEITRAVKASDIVLVCLSRISVTKEGFVQREIKQALDVASEKPERTIYLIPLRLDDCTVPDQLSIWQWLNYYEIDGYEKLMAALFARAEQLGIASRSKVPPSQNLNAQGMSREILVRAVSDLDELIAQASYSSDLREGRNQLFEIKRHVNPVVQSLAPGKSIYDIGANEHSPTPKHRLIDEAINCRTFIQSLL